MTPGGSHEESVEARDSSQQRETRAKPQTDTQADPQRAPPAESNASVPSQGVVWVRISPSQVIRTVIVALVTAAVVLVAFFLLWQVRTFVGWFVIALFLATMLNPAVNWLQRRHRLIKRPIAIVLTYLGVVMALLFMVGILVPVLVDQIQGLIKFVAAVANAPEGPQNTLRGSPSKSG